MKKHILISSITAMVSAFIFQICLYAQPQDLRPMPPKGVHMLPMEFIEELKQELNLTSEQESKIQKILDTQAVEMKNMFDAERKERDSMRKKFEKQRKETDLKISGVLTEEQNKKYENMQKKHVQRPPRPRRYEGENDRFMHGKCPDNGE
jgi:Spy/CpxP family protein refolding chaperone